MSPRRIALRPMSTAEFARYLDTAIPEYARAHIRAGDVDPKKALGKAKAEYAELLPKGVATRGHHLSTITLADGGVPIGMLWFGVKQRHGKRKAYIFDFRLDKAQRGKGLGRKALAALEREARRLGAIAIDLHVFGANVVARALYESSGYRCMHMNMTKVLR